MSERIECSACDPDGNSQFLRVRMAFGSAADVVTPHLMQSSLVIR